MPVRRPDSMLLFRDRTLHRLQTKVSVVCRSLTLSGQRCHIRLPETVRAETGHRRCFMRVCPSPVLRLSSLAHVHRIALIVNEQNRLFEGYQHRNSHDDGVSMLFQVSKQGWLLGRVCSVTRRLLLQCGIRAIDFQKPQHHLCQSTKLVNTYVIRASSDNARYVSYHTFTKPKSRNILESTGTDTDKYVVLLQSLV